ncbi:MAG: preprotein translocase subunit SecG [Candidatus Delongbacteria bacterium]|nr:preprotein translocase subunit SecG [Candidatus Cloacimonadota bacterium]MCB9473427.1 preprotein translocase subunit SecG [Candidatus Delongbacteria bacterium]
MLYSIVFVLAVLVAGLLMVVILMQSSKGDGLSSAFGGGGGAVNAAFSTRQATNALHKVTINLVAAFMVLSLLATVLSRAPREGTSVVTREALEQKRLETGFSESIPTLELPVTGDPAPAETAPAGDSGDKESDN